MTHEGFLLKKARKQSPSFPLKMYFGHILQLVTCRSVEG